MSESTPTPTDPREEKPDLMKWVHSLGCSWSQGGGNINLPESAIISLLATNSKLAAENAELRMEIVAVLDQLPSAIRVHEGSAAENICASLAVSVAALRAELEAKQKVAFEAQNAAITITAELEAARKERDAALELVRLNHETYKANQDALYADRDTALAAKDAWERSSIAWQENHAKALERVDALWEELTAQRRLENWVIQLRGRGYIKAADSLIGGFLSDIDKARALLTPAPTQEPPAGGVTISNDSSRVEGHAEAEGRSGYMGNAQPSEYQASPAVTSSTSPADVPSEGRGEWMPIETAPDDKTELMLGWKKLVCSGHWDETLNAWVTSHGTYRGSFNPTHWQPLPPPPMLPTEGSGA